MSHDALLSPHSPSESFDDERPLSDETLDYGTRLMEALVGVDSLYRRESGDEDGLAVLNMDWAGRFSGEVFEDYPEAADRLVQLRGEATGLPEADRRRYYEEACRSVLAFLTWRANGLSFRDQLQGFLHVPPRPASDRELSRLRDGMDELLGRLGFQGDLAARFAAWEADRRVPPEEVARVTTELLDAAWDRTQERVMPIPAPRENGMRVEAVSGVAYNARCDYAARTIQLNVDPILTRPALKHLAVHEGYPGHFLQFRMRELFVERGLVPPDGLLSLVNSASSCVFEGIADAGMEIADWIESDDDRLQALLNRYRAGIGTVAAWKLHAEGEAAPAVEDWLRQNALVGGDGWVQNRIRFISAPARAVLIWSYWWGEPTVAEAWREVDVERRGAFLRHLYGRMHSNASVRMFG
ncbi:MAG: hypothetical protein P8188_10900 [Gemmatimonadota bacterium]